MDLIPIFIVVIAGVAIYAFTLFQRVSKLEDSLRLEAGILAEKKAELEKSKKESRERRDELEETKKQLQETRNKLRKREPEQREKKDPAGKKARGEEGTTPAPPPVIVRVSDSELTAEHEKTVSRLEGEIAALKSELGAFRAKEAARERESARAAAVLAASVEAPALPEVSVEPRPVEEGRADLAAQLDAMRKAAVDRERELKRALRKSEGELRHALARASNNHQLYAVIKGQLELLEDRLAAYRVKYEGAKSLDELKRESSRDRNKRQRRRERSTNGRAQTSGKEASGSSADTAPSSSDTATSQPGETSGESSPTPHPASESVTASALADAGAARDEGLAAKHVVALDANAPAVAPSSGGEPVSAVQEVSASSNPNVGGGNGSEVQR